MNRVLIVFATLIAVIAAACSVVTDETAELAPDEVATAGQDHSSFRALDVPIDEPSECGDGSCTTSQENRDTCYVDCGYCRDGFCTASHETASSCHEDCGRCNDGICGGTETASSCHADCGRCGDHVCTGPENGANCPFDCCRNTPSCVEYVGHVSCQLPASCSGVSVEEWIATFPYTEASFTSASADYRRQGACNGIDHYYVTAMINGINYSNTVRCDQLSSGGGLQPPGSPGYCVQCPMANCNYCSPDPG